jgi:hypothetical protein
MKQMTQDMDFGFRQDEFSNPSDFTRDYPFGQNQPQKRKSAWPGADTGKSLEKTTESMVSAYLGVNLNFRHIPLKEFLDDFERNILQHYWALNRPPCSKKCASTALTASRLNCPRNWKRRSPGKSHKKNPPLFPTNPALGFSHRLYPPLSLPGWKLPKGRRKS